MVKKFYTKSEGDEFLKKVYKEFDEYKKNGKNLFQWFCDQPSEFLKLIAETNEKSPKKTVSLGTLGMMLALRSYEIENDCQGIPEEKIKEIYTTFHIVAAMAHFKVLGMAETSDQSKWMSPESILFFRPNE
jgi:hypothetical protein